MQFIHIRLQYFFRLLVTVFNIKTGLFINSIGYSIGIITILGYIPAQENFFTFVAEGDGAQFLRHAIFGDHLAHDAAGPFQIVLGAGADIIENQGFGHPSPQKGSYFVQQIGAGNIVAVFLRQQQGVAPGPPPGYNRNFMQFIGMGKEIADYGMPAFMIGHQLFLFFRHNPGLFLRTGYNPFNRLFHFLHPYGLISPPGSQKSSLIDHIGQIRSGKTRRPFGQNFQINILGHRFALYVYLQDGFPALDIWPVNQYMTIKSSRS